MPFLAYLDGGRMPPGSGTSYQLILYIMFSVGVHPGHPHIGNDIAD